MKESEKEIDNGSLNYDQFTYLLIYNRLITAEKALNFSFYFNCLYLRGAEGIA